MQIIKTPQDFERIFRTYDLRNGFTGVGGYPLYFVMKDSESICFKCAEENKALIESAIKDGYEKDWIPYCLEINFESDLTCCNCYKQIESAYGVYEEKESGQ